MYSLMVAFINRAQDEGLPSAIVSAYHYLLSQLFVLLQPITDTYYSKIAIQNAPINHYGVQLPAGDPVFSKNVRARFARGNYESAEAEAIQQYYDGKEDVLDLGASTGFLSVLSDNIANGTSNIIAIEANPDMIPVLKETKRMNQSSFKIDYCAYSSTGSSVDFNRHELTVGGSVQRETENQVSVPAKSITDILETHDLQKPIMVICDIEGGEVDLLLNDLQELERTCSLLILETHWFAQNIEEAEAALLSSRFELVSELNGTVVYANSGISDQSI